MTSPSSHSNTGGTAPTVLADTIDRVHSVTVIVPTRNESANVEPLVERVGAAMATTDWRWDVMFVDDSDDDTPDVVAALEQAGQHVRLCRRPAGSRSGGLSGAVLAGFARANGDVFVVIDGDLQHPPEALPALLAPLADSSVDLSVATRYAGAGADVAGLASTYRRIVSRTGRRAVHLLFAKTRSVSDPLGGFFAVRRDVVEHTALRADGFKILLEVLVRAGWKSIVEVPYKFAERTNGSSKAGWREGVRFIRQLARLRATTPLHANGYTR